MKPWSPLCLLICLIVALLSKGRQVRSQTTTTSVCIQPFLDANGDIIVVTDCVCDPTCAICGFYGEAVSGLDDCFTCPDGLVFTELYTDGSGTCSSGTTDPVDTLSPSGFTDVPTEPNTSTFPPDSGTGGSTTSTPGGICMMVYQVADNDLDGFIRVDVSEITISPFTQSSSTTTWIYHDGLDFGDEFYTGGPLLDVYNPDGSVLSESNSASRYLKWDHALGKMVVETTFSSELNSDDPAVLQAFLEYALTDCVAKQKSEFFLALSSHGGGFIGFGGDYDAECRRRHRKLLQSTADMVSAIQGALSSVSGAPSQLDVLGFDACLMQSMDAIDDFASITRYYLASEATEPGHGWAYNELSATTSAIDLAVEVVDTFVSSLQDYSKHQTPKTLAVVDTTAYFVFRDAWDAMCAAMAGILSSGNDADFHVSLLRARAKTVSFSNLADNANTQINSAMDIGDFFVQFFQLCDPDQSSELYNLMMNALDAYNAMFVTAKLGPGTPFGTGMHITWVSKQEYLNYQDVYDDLIFPVTGSSPLMGAPNYSALLSSYYSASTPVDNVGTSVCGTSTGASISVESPSELLIDPKLVFVDTVTTELRSEITRSVDFVYVEYGIDVTHLLQDDGMRRRLEEAGCRQKARKLEVGEGGLTRLSSLTHQHQAIKWRYRDTGGTTRRLQQDAEFDRTGDYFLIYGGSVSPEYNGANVVASWDSTFFWIESGEDLEPVYAYDDGGGLKSIPVCFFDQNHPVTSDQIPVGVTVDDAMTNLGCEEGYLSFSVAEDSDGDINLYVYRGNTLSSVAVAAGRSIVPISYIELSIGDDMVFELLGGFTSVIIPWTPESKVMVYAFSDSENMDVFESETAFLQIYAYDEDSEVNDISLLPYHYEGTSSGSSNGTENGTENSNENSGALSLEVGMTTFILVCSTTMIFF